MGVKIVLIIFSFFLRLENRSDSEKVIREGLLEIIGASGEGLIDYVDTIEVKGPLIQVPYHKSGILYWIKYWYKNVPFEFMIFPQEKDTVSLSIFEPTKDNKKFPPQRFHLVISPLGKDSLNILGVIIFNAETSLVYFGEPIFWTTLPKKFSSFSPLTPLSSEFWHTHNDTLLYLGPIYPDGTPISFSYNIPKKTKEFSKYFSITLPLVDVFVAEDLKVSKSNLTYIGKRTLGGNMFNHLHGGNINQIVIGFKKPILETHWLITILIVSAIVIIAFLVDKCLRKKRLSS